MTIAQIKSQLSITTVLSHYGLSPNRHDMLCCPFHDDKQASMKIYKETNTAYCFAGSCEVESVDVIDFIMRKEGCTKHEAIVKAKSLCHHITQVSLFTKTTKAMKSTDAQSMFRSYHKALHNHKLSQEYCESRCLDWRLVEIGYKSRKTAERWGRGCIIFPLVDAPGNIVSLYGRGITGSSHFYQADRRGLYPSYPSRTARTLILLESVIDAATLQPLELPLENYALLSLYGTNGLTDEHLKAIGQLPDLEEIIFAMDGDEAGRLAIKEHMRTLGRLCPQVRMSTLELPEGEDINSMAVGHEHHASLFVELLSKRKALTGQLSQTVQAKAEVKLDTSDPYNLAYLTPTASYYIKGGIRSSTKDLHHLKITLVAENERGKKSRNGLDLYEDRQIEKTARHIADRLGLRADLVELDLHALTDELESYRKAVQQNNGNGKVKVSPPSANQRAACMKLWKSKGLLQKIDGLLERYGIIGEYNNRRLGFCIASSSQMPRPLHGLIQGSSGSGKTHLLSALCALVPEEHYLSITRATDNSFYNYQKYDLKNKLISIEDKDSMSDEANLAFRELQSKGMVSLSTTGQDEQGHNRSYVKEVYGPIASLACTTKGELYLDDMNRCFLLAVDEGEAQTERILAHQKRVAAGEIREGQKEEIASFMQCALRLLEPLEVVIPQATRIHLPEDVKDKRRLNSLYLSLVGQITLLHQYQRKKDGAGRLIATTEDLELANEIMFDAIVLKVDDLHGPLRSFYEKLKEYLKEVAGRQAEKYSFRQRELRQALRMGRTSVYNYLRELLEMEYIQITGGSDRRGYDYKVNYWDDNEGLRQRIKTYLQKQIENTKECSHA